MKNKPWASIHPMYSGVGNGQGSGTHHLLHPPVLKLQRKDTKKYQQRYRTIIDKVVVTFFEAVSQLLDVVLAIASITTSSDHGRPVGIQF